MHELGIAQAILDRVAVEVKRHPGTRPIAVGVLIGEVSGVDNEALAFGFEALVKDTEWERLMLKIESRSRLHRCPACAREFHVTRFDTACPDCGNAATVMLNGDELDIAYIEVEDL
jgi:hydrogenase nickel incorporation protein HypA/HybF